MKFIFNLESVLKHRKINKELAQKDYLLAQSKADESMRKIEEMYQQIEKTYHHMHQLRKETGASMLAELDSSEQFIDSLKVKIDREKINFRSLAMVAEEKKDVLVEAAKEHKSLELLKEKKKEEFKKRLRKKETKELDDIANGKYNRGVIHE